MTREFLTLLALVVTAAAVVPAQRRTEPFGQSNDEWCRDTESHSDREIACEVRDEMLGPLSSIDVNTGGNGGIVVRGADTRDVRLRVRLSASGRTQEEARDLLSRIELSTSGGHVVASGPWNTGGRGWWSAAMELEVPRNIEMKLGTTNGGIQVSDYDGSAIMATTNGGIVMQNVDGNIRGRTTNGGLRVSLRGQRWEGTGLDLQATNGGVTLDVPDGYSANLEARTANGGIRIDFPVTVQGAMSRRQVTATLGSGGAPLRMTTTNGGITISQR